MQRQLHGELDLERARFCWVEDFYPYYPEHCYSLQENGVDISASGYSKAFSGKAAGSYQYQLYYRSTVAGQPWDEYVVEGPVTVSVVRNAPGTPSGPSVDYSGAYTISWSGVLGATSYRLEEQGELGEPLAGDWTGDGRTDLFVSLSNTWQIYPGKADGLFDTTVNTSLASSTSPSLARVFDFNGDGLADLLYQDGTSTWKVAPSNGTTGFDSSINTGLSTSTVVNPMLQDHNGDGLADLVYSDTESVYWVLNQGGSFEIERLGRALRSKAAGMTSQF